MQSFNDYFSSLKKQVAFMCLDIDENTNYRIEYNDLFQEATLKLLQIYKDNKPTDINYSIKAVENCLTDYVNKNSLENEINVGLINEEFII